MEAPKQDFVSLITQEQTRIYNYIISLIGRQESAWDVLQETNRVLWLKKEEYVEGTNFVSWALTTARFQTMAFLRDAKRSKLVLTEELVEVMSEEAEEMANDQSDRLEALKACMSNLKSDHKALFSRRYVKNETLEQITDNTSYNVNALKQLFFRLRKKLKTCIDTKVTESQIAIGEVPS